MRPEDIDAARTDLADWSQPIIVDYLFELYVNRLGADHHSLRALALSHGRMWRFLVLDDLQRIEASRREVFGIARLAGLRKNIIDDIDHSMLTELMDVVVTRFLRSPTQARAFTHIVLGAASRLAALAVAA